MAPLLGPLGVLIYCITWDKLFASFNIIHNGDHSHFILSVSLMLFSITHKYIFDRPVCVKLRKLISLGTLNLIGWLSNMAAQQHILIWYYQTRFPEFKYFSILFYRTWLLVFKRYWNLYYQTLLFAKFFYLILSALADWIEIFSLFTWNRAFCIWYYNIYFIEFKTILN